jgi:hypothetical protein
MDCPELEEELEKFLDDPYTIAYGMGSEMLPAVEAGHRRRHGCKEFDPGEREFISIDNVDWVQPNAR